MNQKTVKLIKQFCEYHHKPFKLYVERYKKLNTYNKTKVREAIVKALPN